MLSDGIMKKSVSLNSVGLARDARDSVPPWKKHGSLARVSNF